MFPVPFYDALGKCTWCFNLELEADILYCFSPDACEFILRSLMVSASRSWESVPARLRLLETVCVIVRAVRRVGCGDGRRDGSFSLLCLLSFPALRKYACVGSAQFSLHLRNSFWEMVLFAPTLCFLLLFLLHASGVVSHYLLPLLFLHLAVECWDSAYRRIWLFM